MQNSSKSYDEIVSPCTGVCTLGPGNLCIGCLRTSDEIGNWLKYSPQDRNRILSDRSNRMETLFAR